jgi:amidohydrolase
MSPDGQLALDPARRSRRSAHLDRTRPAVIAWRRHLHSHPELSFQEHQTARYISAALADLGLAPTSPTATSVVADIDGARPGRTIAVRADIDALPIIEDTGLPFASQNSGVMHACGHDGHAAVLLGVAAVLSASRAELPGRVRLIFQHAEECSPHGAPELIDAGVLDGVEAIIGQHLFPALPLGVVGVSRGLMMASSDRFEISFAGHGAHGGMPHEGRDPVAAAAELVQAVQRLVACEIDPRQPAIASITLIRAGEALNVIPATAVVGGSLRAFDRGIRTQLRERIAELCEQVAATHRMGAHVAFDRGLPPLVNTGAITEVIKHIVVDADMDLRTVEPITASEDFACYLERVPGAYMLIGARPSGVSEPFPHHHPRFDIHEDALVIATTVLAETAASLADPLTAIAGAGSLA